MLIKTTVPAIHLKNVLFLQKWERLQSIRPEHKELVGARICLYCDNRRLKTKLQHITYTIISSILPKGRQAGTIKICVPNRGKETMTSNLD